MIANVMQKKVILPNIPSNFDKKNIFSFFYKYNKLLIIHIFIITFNDSKCNSKNIAKMHPIVIQNSIKYIIIFRLFNNNILMMLLFNRFIKMINRRSAS